MSICDNSPSVNSGASQASRFTIDRRRPTFEGLGGTMPIAFDRSICCDLNETISREWLITNGRGGYASGTIAGTLTRLQHGWLVASLNGGNAPQLLLAKLDEEIVFDQRTYYLGTNEYKDG